jgi:cytochrome b6-f complex iron-sulfur subunit
MNAELIVPIGVAVVAILAIAAALTVAWRRSSGAEWKSKVSSETLSSDKSGPIDIPVARPEPSGPAVESGSEPAEAEPAEQEPQPAAVVVAVEAAPRVVEVSPEEAGVTRRSFLNRALGITFLGGFLGTQALAFLSFLWPKVSGGFGSDVIAGKVTDLMSQVINADGSVTPAFIPEARAYIVPGPDDLSAEFEGKNVFSDGLFALYQRCVHLGCRVPWCQTSQGFECPCHGSKYNGIGEYFAGPAPRNLDRFVVEVADNGDFIVKTGTIIETPRAIEKSVQYPLGPSCIGG